MRPRVSPGALRVRLALWLAGVMTAALLAFGGAVYLAAVAAEAAEDEPEHEKERELQAVRARLWVALLTAIPVAVGAAAAGAHLLSRGALAALGEIVRTTGALSLENLSQRIPADAGAGREVAGLVAALNGMLDRIERSAQGLRRFTADAAHELRTPLSVLRSDLEICLQEPRRPEALREQLGQTLEGLLQLGQLVEVLLTLARSDAGALEVARCEVELGALAAQIAAPFEAVAAERGLRLVIAPPPAAVTASTDPLLLGRALANLIDNACKFCAPGGTVTVRVDPGGPDPGPSLVVEDTGPGLGAGDLLRARERFYRAAGHRGSTTGFGLGLALTGEFMTALGGTLDLHSSERAGTTARLRLPRPLEHAPLEGRS